MDQNRPKRILKYLGIWVIISIVLCGVFFTGYYEGRQGSGGNIGIPLINSSKGQSKNVDFSLFWQTWNIINQKFVGGEDTQKRVYGAIDGMVNSLGDPYTTFLSPTETTQFSTDLSGSFEGIGAEIGMKSGQVTIVAPIAGSPAEKAGLKPLDTILEIDKKSTTDMSLDQAVMFIRGKSGTPVSLTVMRKGWDAPQIFKITREKILIKSATMEIKDNNIAYIKLTQFGSDTLDLMDGIIKEIQDKNIKEVVIDERNNPGGLLDVAVQLTGKFIKPGVVVERLYKDGHKEYDKSTEQPVLPNVKLVILVNNGSASASEIFAGAIQDAKRGIVVGEKTYGKGSVQDLEPLPGGASLKVTIAKWLTPKGRVVDGKGIEPDILVASPKEGESDTQLQRALQEALK